MLEFTHCRAAKAITRLVFLQFATLIFLSGGRPEASAQLSGTWTGTLDATELIQFGGPPSCSYDQQFTNVTMTLTLGDAGVPTAEVTGTSTERPVQPCPDSTGPPTLHRYVLDSWSTDGAGGTLNFRQISGSPGVSLVFNGTLRPDRRIQGTLVWRRVDQTSPLDWTIAAPIILDNPASGLAAPTGLSSQVNGFAVTLSWAAVSGATGYILQVGSTQGAANLLTVTLPQNQISGIAPIGIYYWRVLATNGAVSSVPSAESQFVVGCSPPSAPQNLTHSVVGNIVTLQWSGSDADYIIEAGSQTGLSNLYNAATGSAATQLTVAAPLGTYYVRIRARNACGGVSGPSNEQLVVVGGPPPCTFTLSPPALTVGANGGEFSAELSTGLTCSWTASGNQSWLQLTGLTQGVGSATLTGTIAANSGPIRNGSITVGGATLSITQTGVDPPCTYSVSPATESVDKNGGQREIAISTTSNCNWQATSNSPWISFATPSSGTGNATLRYNVSANGAGPRTGQITVVGSGATPPVSYVTTVNQAGEVFTASIASSGNCNVHTTCSTCQLTVTTNMPGPTTYTWDLAQATHGGTSQPVTDTPTISGPNWSAYHEEACKIPGGQIGVGVSVTVTNAAGATASGNGIVSVFRT